MNRSYVLKDTLVRIENVSLSFDGKPVLTSVNAEIKDIVRPDCTQGQIVGILGPSGVGKTQLSRIMTGLQKPTSGIVTVGPERTPIEAGRVGFVPQNYPLLRHRTIIWNLIIAARRGGSTFEQAKEKAQKYLERFDLADKWDMYPAQLSGGQRQRVAIAQQLLCSENYLVLDEPTTGLDPIMRDRVCDFIRQISSLAEENTIFVISHDIASILTIADTLWLLGRKRDANGVSIGASIVQTYDLIDRGIAWHESPSATPAYLPLIREIRERFETL